jgi:chromosomal replication initiation ATPase DnaA
MKVQYDRVRGDSQKMDVVLCRKVISYFLRKKRKAGYEAIADLLGYKDHTNIMYNIKWINEQMPINYEVRLLIENVDYELKFTAK